MSYGSVDQTRPKSPELCRPQPPASRNRTIALGRLEAGYEVIGRRPSHSTALPLSFLVLAVVMFG